MTTDQRAEISASVAHDPVNHPKHYTQHPSGVECIVITEHMNFCLGNAMKYIWRAGEKDNVLEDLRKARWYLDREIELRAKRANTKPTLMPVRNFILPQEIGLCPDCGGILQCMIEGQDADGFNVLLICDPNCAGPRRQSDWQPVIDAARRYANENQ
mgnify:CR=1 FL=1